MLKVLPRTSRRTALKPKVKRPRIVALVGPTASGKTPLSLLLAELLKGEIVSADSRQIYRHLDIGTAKPSEAERKKIKHHLIDLLDPDEEYSAGQFGSDAREVIEGILQSCKVPILVGGSGLYVKAAIDGLFEGPGKDPEIRERLELQLANEGVEGLLETLKKIDPATISRMVEVTPRRVIRALEVYYATGKPLSQFHAEQEREAAFKAVQFGLDWPRSELYERINRRVDRMMADGLVGEVRQLKMHGFGRRLNALNTVGYKEVLDYLEGLLDEDETVALIKQNTRRFAKRQLTWFRADRRIRWLAMSAARPFDDVAHEVIRIFKSSRDASNPH